MDREEARGILARLHEAQGAFYAGGPEEPLRALLTEDIAWTVPGSNAIAGEYRGIDAVMAYFRRRRDLAARTFRMHPGDLLVGDGDRVAVLTDGTAVIGGCCLSIWRRSTRLGGRALGLGPRLTGSGSAVLGGWSRIGNEGEEPKASGASRARGLPNCPG